MKTVYVGLSGGVDSSVAAALLVEQGYRVVGVHLKNWTRDIGGVACPWADDLRDGRAVAAALQIPFKVFDCQGDYRRRVVDVMIAEYQAGRTPNPDVLCNEAIKFKLFLEMALADGADSIATGHYARVVDGRLERSADDDKDQTYFLYRVGAEALSRTIFPLGDLTKPQVRRLAARLGLPTATKPDSQGICFVGEVGLKEFLVESAAVKPAAGPVVLRGAVIGQHDGAIFYTIGQRHGLGIGGGRPLYVTGKDMAANTVYVTDDPADLALSARSIELSDPIWPNGLPAEGETVAVRLRHRGQMRSAVVRRPTSGVVKLDLLEPERAVAVGQAAVVYRGRALLGGGVIGAAVTLAV